MVLGGRSNPIPNPNSKPIPKPKPKPNPNPNQVLRGRAVRTASPTDRRDAVRHGCTRDGMGLPPHSTLAL
eukprot:scaffold95331_cov69-Phaeocystis_antarctica.AAC.5